MNAGRVVVRRLTVVLLVASTALLVPGLVGIDASVALVAALAAAGFALALVRNALADLSTVLGYDLGRYAPDLPFAAFLAAAVVAAFLDASSAELQSLGGLAGVAAIVNYFLGPVYLYVYSLANSAGQRLSGS